MSKKSSSAFYDWLEEHEYKDHISEFLEWAERYNLYRNPSGTFERSPFETFTQSLLYLDDLSDFLVKKQILSSPLFRPGQFFNPDKLMRAASKSGVISLILQDVAPNRLSEMEEWMWYTMRLYSSFLDFHTLDEDETSSFIPLIDEVILPKKLIVSQNIAWVLLTLIIIAVGGLSVYYMFVSMENILTSIAILLLFILILIFWVTQGIQKSFPHQLKEAKEVGDLCSLNGRIVSKKRMKPFGGINLTTDSVFISPLHDSIGKSFLFHSIAPLDVSVGKTPMQIVFLKDLDIIVDIREAEQV